MKKGEIHFHEKLHYAYCLFLTFDITLFSLYDLLRLFVDDKKWGEVMTGCQLGKKC